jgi:hypothetical protein
LLGPREIRSLLVGARLGSVQQDYVLFFPHALARLRPFEPLLRWFPLGAQTLTIGAAPARADSGRVAAPRPPGRAGAV